MTSVGAGGLRSALPPDCGDRAMLTVGKHRFEIARAAFRAYVSIGANGWEVSWSLEVMAQPRDIDGIWEPRLRSHGSLGGLPHPDELPGTRVGPFGRDADGESVFLLYIFEHEPVDDVVLEFGERRHSQFWVTLTGTTAGYDSADEQTVPLAVQCWATFAGVTVDERRIESARARLAQFFGESDWVHAEEGARHVFRLSNDA